MDFSAFLDELRARPEYRDQVVYVREQEAREARFAETEAPLPAPVRAMLKAEGIDRLYAHQAAAVDAARRGENVVVVSATASGKTLCYTVPLVETLLADPDARALMLFPTKALSQDQFRNLARALANAGLGHRLAGVHDGDTPGHLRRKLRDNGSVILSNPDMLHAGILPQHARWAAFLKNLRLLVLDELHVYSGIFGSNMADVMTRFRRVCRHYGSDPQVVASSATIGNPRELAERVTGKPATVIGPEQDGSPRGRRTFCFWNPPRIRGGDTRSRRSANVEAHELMALLIQRGVPTITFSKAKMTAEMIHRYVTERLRDLAPEHVKRVTPYRGGYIPAERREIERRLFDGELLGVSTTRALELGIDVGGLDASILVGYPGTLASFFQQAGRAGRRDRDALAVLVGLDTSINQYVMTHPEYLFGRPIEEAVIDPDNPFVALAHLRCAAHELPLPDDEAAAFGPHAPVVLQVLEENRKVRRIGDTWYHAAAEVPQHEISLRQVDTENVTIQDADSGAVLGELAKWDAPPIIHPEAVYMHRGDTYRVRTLDLERNLCTVERVEVDYYTQPIGGTDVHHVDHRLREKPFGTGRACWGEVTCYDRTWAYEKVHFYSLDAISMHRLDLPRLVLETSAVWLEPPEPLMETVRRAGLDAHSGLRGIGYATRTVLPLFMTCDTLDFSHSIGSANSPWNAVFIWERYTHGLGFTQSAYERLHEILPVVLQRIKECPCADGCPCCVGKPLRQYATWNVERGEAHIPSRPAAIMILEGLLGDGSNLHNPSDDTLTDASDTQRLIQALRRRLERMREPRVFHRIEPEPRVDTAYPAIQPEQELDTADVGTRRSKRKDFGRALRKRLGKKIDDGTLSPTAAKKPIPTGMTQPGSSLPPTAFPGRPAVKKETADAPDRPDSPPPRKLGSSLAARARRKKRKK